MLTFKFNSEIIAFGNVLPEVFTLKVNLLIFHPHLLQNDIWIQTKDFVSVFLKFNCQRIQGDWMD